MKELIDRIKAKPILFQTDMVKAINSGLKTETRRIIKFPKDWDGKTVYDNSPFGCKYGVVDDDDIGNTLLFRLPWKAEVGDYLWVRETWSPKRHNFPTGWHFEYKATAKEDGTPENEPWKPSIFMPKEACRTILQITDINAERVQDITEEGAMAEGIIMNNTPHPGWYWMENVYSTDCPILAYEKLWTKINGKDSWNQNPWVFVIKFKNVTNELIK